MITSPKDEPRAPHEEFSRIFNKLKIPEEYEFLMDWWETLRSMDLSNYADVHEMVENDLIPALKPEDANTEDPFIHVFLAHWYNLGYWAGEENQVIVDQSIVDAIKGFKSGLYNYGDQLNRYNQAISNWYHGLYFYFDSEYDRRIYQPPIVEAMRIINDLLNEYEGIKPPDDFYNDLQDISEALKPWYDQLSPKNVKEPFEGGPPTGIKNWLKRPKLKDDSSAKEFTLIGRPKEAKQPPIRKPDDTRFRKTGFEVPQVEQSFKSQKKRISPGEPPKIPPSIPRFVKEKSRPLDITIPVDLQAIQKLASTSLNIFEQLRLYNERNENRPQAGKKSPLSEREIKKNPLRKTIIPPFPILYGGATAGTQGEIILPSPDDLDQKVNAVDETLQVEFNGFPYKVFSATGDDNVFSNIRGKKYYWISIEGESMNNAYPVPVDNEDYVLFNYKTWPLEFYTGKIVVAALPDPEPQESSAFFFAVKRVVRYKMDNSEFEYKYFLRSESLDTDPETGEDYEDIELINDEQIKQKIIGEVIAIAKLEKE